MGRRFFRHGELHLAVLALLAIQPRNGHEVMGELARLFGPTYRPSPGSVYPALKALGAEGLLDVDPAGDGTRLRTTAEGELALEERRDQLVALEARTGVHLARGDEVAQALDRLGATARAAAGVVDPAAITALVDAATSSIQDLHDHRTTRPRRTPS